MVKRDAGNEVGRLDEIVADFVRRATMTEIPSRDRFIGRPRLDVVVDETDDREA